MQDNNKDITPYNNKEQPHGYWEMYWNNKLWYKCFFVNGVIYGHALTYDEKKYYAR